MEIIKELPKPTEAEMRMIQQRLLELAAHNEDIELCNEAASQGALMLDQLEEEEDARRGSR